MRDGSAIKSACCSSKGPEFSFHHPCQVTYRYFYLSISLSPWDPVPSTGLQTYLSIMHGFIHSRHYSGLSGLPCCGPLLSLTNSFTPQKAWIFIAPLEGEWTCRVGVLSELALCYWRGLLFFLVRIASPVRAGSPLASSAGDDALSVQDWDFFVMT